MSKAFMNKRKTMTAIVAVVMCAVIIFGGTFAWQSISQEALNEVSSVTNPGGRLHDDFVDITYGANGIADFDTMTFNKDVYVENFTSLSNNGVQVFARVRLDEYMEFGKGAGALNDEGTAPAVTNEANSLVSGAELADRTTWTTHKMNNNANDPFHKYWSWDLSGQTTYMPTFNKDNTSLNADVNGVFGDFENTYTDYAGVSDKYDDVTQKIANAIYETDNEGNVTKAVEETHTVKQTLNAGVISMDDYIKRLADEDPNNDTGNFWVWDTDGWAYWAAPINPDTATGLLLDQIQRTNEIINEDWYYAINVVAQFITKDDIGYEDGDGFYSDGETVTPEALRLLRKIGVEVTFDVDDAKSLKDALIAGGSVNLNNKEISGATAYAPTYTDSEGASVATNFDVNYAATNGTTLFGGTLNIDAAATTDPTYGLFLWTENGNGADNIQDVTVKDVTIVNDSAAKVAVYSQALNADIVMDNVTVNSTNGVGIASEHHSGFDLILKNCTVNQSGVTNSEKPWTQAAVAAWGNGSIVIESGTYSSAEDGWAVYAYSTGGNITINGGTFNGKLGCDAGSLVIYGGTFSVDPSDYVPAGYSVTENNDTWTVTAAN